MEVSLTLYISIALLFILILIINTKVVQQCSFNKYDTVKFILWFPLLLLLQSLMIVIIPVGKLIQGLIGNILRIKFGNEYFGILQGTDLTMGCNKWHYSFIKVLFVIEYNKSVATKTLFEYTKELMEKNRMENNFHKKFFATIDQALGYLFFRKINVNINDLVRQMPLSQHGLDKIELAGVLRNCMYRPLPLDGTALWDIQVGVQPLKWKSNPDLNIEYYPMLVRTHHAIADGISLIKHLKLLFQDESSPSHAKPDVFAALEPKSASWFRKLLKEIYACINTFALYTSAVYITLFLRGHDHNDLHNKPFTNEELFQFVTDKDGEYFKKVKNIKKLHGHVSFSEILIAAYGASLNEFYQKYSSSCPKFITLALPIVYDYHRLKGIASDQVTVKNIEVSNNFIFLQMHFPINITNDKAFDSTTPCISRLNIIRKVSENLRTISQQQFSYILMHLLMGCLPVWVARKFLSIINTTTVGSFLPGPPKFSYCKGALAISDCLFWLTHIVQIGIAFTTFTFDDKLQMGLSCNGQLTEQSHVDEILNNVYKYIDLTEKELKTYYKIE